MKTEKTISQNRRNSPCLSRRILLDYAENRLSPKEMHEAEKHMIECEFCNDAAEGLALFQGSGSEAHIIEAALKTKNSSTKKQKSFILYSGIAASFLIFMSAVIILYQIMQRNKEEQGTHIAVLSEENPNPDSKTKAKAPLERNTKTEQGMTNPDENRPIIKQKYQEEKPNKNKQTDRAEKISDARDQFLSVEKEESTKAITSPKKSSPQVFESGNASGASMTNINADDKADIIIKAPVQEAESAPSQMQKANIQKDEESRTEDLQTKNEEAIPAQALEKKMRMEKSAAMPQAMYSLNSVELQGKQSHEENSKTYYDKGMNAYKSKRTKEAIKNFKKLLKEQPSSYTEEGKFYLGLSYLEISDSLNYKSIFNEIIQSGSPFRGRAIEEIKKTEKP